jgi:glycosyltransferase involved in cell wall biosynthesis
LKVSACIITYNQEDYIVQCLEGVLSQIVDFDYEIVIGEDKSTDGTLAICKKYAFEYPDKIKLIERPINLGMIGNWFDTLKNCEGKYIAICEGDDYWTDPLKLQKQVDFLEANDDYSFSFHDCTILQESTKKEGLRIGDRKIDETPDLKSVIISNNMPTASLVFRTMDWDKLPKWFFEISKGDYGLVVLLAAKGRGKYFHEPMSVYRVHDGGVWSGKDFQYYYEQDLIFYDYLLDYFKDHEVQLEINWKVKYTHANHGIYLMRTGLLIKGFFKVIINNDWKEKHHQRIGVRKMASAIKQGIGKY